MTHILEFAGVGLDKKDGIFGKSDPYLQFIRVDDNSPVHITEYVKQNLNPEWRKLYFNQKRFGNEQDPTVLVECWDWDSGDSHDLIGTFRAKCSELAHTGSEFQLVSKKGKNSGKIVVKSAAENVLPPFPKVTERKEEPVKKEEPPKKDNDPASDEFDFEKFTLSLEQETPKEMTKEERDIFDENKLANLFADFQAGKGETKEYQDALILAVQRGKPDIVRALIASERVDPAFNSNEPIRMSSISKNGAESMRILLTDPRVDPTTYDIPLSNSCHYGNEEMVKMLLSDSRINPSSANNRALRNAIDGTHKNVVKLLLAHPKLVLTSANKKEFHL
eukprot:TRINITY_DN1067_c0_g1_i2.p1 TRINITY_DN1067_c0_g1~~TRINITY_DN1067_c0_g1_i2.p1  ORF type:complete len:334 (+),score=104.08 TRINITY_DN1067_c0_g1_i2:374-1375(+)